MLARRSASVSVLAAMAACGLLAGSAAATTVQLKPFKKSPATLAACSASGIDLECTASPGTQLEFSTWVEVDGIGFSRGVFGLQWAFFPPQMPGQDVDPWNDGDFGLGSS